MKIQRIEVGLIEAGYLASTLFQSRLATPMSPFPAYSAQRSSWMWPSEKVVTRIVASGGESAISVTSGGHVVATIIDRHLRRFLVGREIDDLPELWEIMFRSLLPFDRSGFALMAIAGVDIALWNLRARLAGQTLTALLGGTAPRKLRAYVTTTQPGEFSGTRFSGLKVPMPCGPSDGSVGVEQNRAAIATARDAVGADGDVMLDAFMGWDVDYTLKMIDVLAPYRVRWFEDPLPPTRLQDYVRLRREAPSDLVLALGNFCYTLEECRQLVDAGVVSLLQPDVNWAGGITETLRIIDLAEANAIPVILHNTAEYPWSLAISAARPSITEVEHVDRDSNSMLHQMFTGGHWIADGQFDSGIADLEPTLSERAQQAQVPFPAAC